MRETTQGSKHKLFAYKVKRIKKSNPVVIAGEFKREYDSIATAVRIPTEKCDKSHKSSGPMKSFKHKSRTSHASMKKTMKKSKHSKGTKKSGRK